MLPTLLAAALILACSIVVGEGLARVLRLQHWRGWSPAVGLATLTVVALAAVKLPGRGDAGAVAVGLLAVAGTVALLLARDLRRPSWEVVALTGATSAAAMVPYIANRRFGIPAVGYTNDPAAHLVWADSLREVPASEAVTAGYPVGPHSLLAALADGTGMSVEHLFSGLLIAAFLMIGWAALPLLDGLGAARRAVAATLATVTYTVAAFYAQAGFKELLLTGFLLAALGIARDHLGRPGRLPLGVGVQVGLLLGATAASFSYGGIGWAVLAAGLWAVGACAFVVLDQRREGVRAIAATVGRFLVRVLPVVAVATATALVAVVADLPRFIDSLAVFGSSPSGSGSITTSNLGHLAGEISKREIFGFWPNEDFRFGYDSTGKNEYLGLLAIAAAAYGGIWWAVRRDLAVPAAVAGAFFIAIWLADNESPYTASKALAPAGALTMLMSARALLAAPPIRLPGAGIALFGIAAVFAASALWSSFLVLRGAQVGPTGHGDDIEALAEQADDGTILFLGNNDYADWYTRASDVRVLPRTRPIKNWDFYRPLDFDTALPDEIDAVRYVITTRTSFRSEPPPNLRLVATTPTHELWERTGPTPRRLVVPGENARPGVILDCADEPAHRALAQRSGWARVWGQRPVIAWLPTDRRGIQPGVVYGQPVSLSAGRWEVSLQYESRQPIDVSFGEREIGTAPPNLDRPGPIWHVGELELNRPARRLARLRVRDDLLGAKTHPAVVASIRFVRRDAAHELIRLDEACGRYVDWYTLGRERPQVPPSRTDG